VCSSDLITGESLGLLIEEQRTNLLVRSEEFDDAAWTKTGTTVDSNVIVAPDGSLVGDKLVENTANAAHSINVGSITTSTTAASTFSFYAKAGERSVIQVRLGVQSLANRGQGNVDLTTGTVALVSNVGTATGTTLTATPVGNGWYRIAISTNPNDAAATQMRVFVILGNVSVNSMTGAAYTGDGFSGIFIWGAQLESASFSTSYIPTVASAVTRAADAASMTGANFSSWFSNAEGTLYAESRCPKGITGNINRIASLNDGTTSNRMEIDAGGAEATVARIQANGVSQGQPSAGSFTDFQLRKSALGIQLNNFTLAANTATNSNISALVPVVDRLMIGQSPAASSNFLNGTLAKIAYYPKRLADGELVALTQV
jgi:nitrogen fixation protein FixH